jgi:uncharacterized zinc-type alcohol dehydrogenase-like protein
MYPTNGYAAFGATEPLRPFAFARRALNPHDVLIEIKYSGICHSDIHQARGQWGNRLFPMVPGHEIAGLVAQVGTAVTRHRVGDPVGVGCFVDSCRTCPECRAGEEQYCEQSPTFTYNGLERDGVTPTYGGYSERIVVHEDFVLRVPASLPLDAAAPLLCAGITTYSPLRHWHAGPGTAVAIVGLGGLGHMGVQFARALGADVTVLSRSPQKQADAIRLGAHHFHVTSLPGTLDALRRRFDLVISTASAETDLDAYLSLLKVGASLVMVGLPETKISAAPLSLVTHRRSLSGSMIGGIRETQEMLDFCAEHRILCDVERIPIQQVNEAYDRVLASDVRYRFVIDASSLAATVHG